MQGCHFFYEDATFWKSKVSHLDSDDEMRVAPKNVESKPKELEPMEQDSLEASNEPHEFFDSPRVIVLETRKRLAWLERTLKEAGHAASRGTFRESKRPNKYSSYATLMSKINESKPSTYEEAIKHQVWKYVVIEEYQSILKNDVWEIVRSTK